MKIQNKITIRFKVMLLLIIISGITTNSCEKIKTYEEGPTFSLRSKMNRITGKWRLVSMEGVERLNPNTEQYMELTKEQTSDGYYKAIFTDFQEEFCWSNPDTSGEALFTTEGTWNFSNGNIGMACQIGEELEDKEGLSLRITDSSGKVTSDKWHIKKLTNKELKIVNNVCIDWACHYLLNRRLTFKKE